MDELAGLYISTCPGCNTRMLAAGRDAWQALRAPHRDPEPLRQALLASFGDAGYLAARQRLWAWVQLRTAQRGTAASTTQ